MTISLTRLKPCVNCSRVIDWLPRERELTLFCKQLHPHHLQGGEGEGRRARVIEGERKEGEGEEEE